MYNKFCIKPNVHGYVIRKKKKNIVKILQMPQKCLDFSENSTAVVYSINMVVTLT